MRILLCTDSPVLSTGLAEATRGIFESLQRSFPGQYEIRQLGFFHGKGIHNPSWQVIPTSTKVAPNGAVEHIKDDAFGQKSLNQVLADFHPEIVFGFGDPWVLQHLTHESVREVATIVLYVNIDGIPCPPVIEASVIDADLIVTTTEFGRTALRNCSSRLAQRRIEVVHHPADVERFIPIAQSAKSDLRRALLPPEHQEAFIVGWVGRDQWRKQSWLPYKVINHLRKGGYCTCSICGRVALMYWDVAKRAYPLKDGH